MVDSEDSKKVEDDDSGSEEEEVEDNNKSGSGGSSGSSSGGSSHSGSGSSSDSSDQSDAEGEGEQKVEDEEEEDYDGDRSVNRSDEDVVEGEGDENSSNRSSRSRSNSGGSRSGSGSERSRSGSAGSSNSGSQLSDSERQERRKKRKEDEKFWEDDPAFYGIRRSNRPRYEAQPPKLEPQVGSKRSPSQKHKHGGKVKRRKISSDEDDSSDDDTARRTVRAKNATVSYKEPDSEDENDELTPDEDGSPSQDNGDLEPEEHVETIERVMDGRMGKKGATGSETTIYSVEENGDPNETLPKETETERQFLIKWTTWSHLHNTWESLDTLQEMKVKGLKKLDNFCKKEDDQSRWKFQASPEDVEYQECQLELQQELVKCYINAERIIAERTTPEGVKEYYVKWECLSYAEATWESADLIKKRSPEAIRIFKKREASNRTPSASSKCLKSRPKFSQTKSQPRYLMGDSGEFILRDYQLDGLNWLVHSWCKENSVILADEMGLGKTIQTICFLGYLFETYNLYGPYLLVVPLSTMAAWQKEFAQWAPQINVVTYLGDISSRDVIREYEWFFYGSRKIKFNAILTTYEIVLKDKAFLSSVPWAALMVDEAHRLKNGDSLLYKTLVEFNSNHRLLITGTPLQNSLKELWSLLHFIMPHTFDDWESFEKEHDNSLQKGYAKLHKQLEPYILRRVKKDVEKSLPNKVEQILRVEMTSAQKEYYKWILTKNYTALRKGVKGSVTSFVNVVMELKKCCNHASLIKPLEKYAGDTLNQLIKGSGKLMLLDKLLVRLKETGHRVLIFSQMVMMLDIIAEYLQLRRFSYQRLDGTIKGDMRKQALEHFNAEGSNDFCFLLSTRAGGLGINLATADTVIIFDSDWNPQNDLQAQARAHRIGQKNQVMIYRLVTKNSVEEDIVERAKQKMVLDHLVIQRMDTTGRTVLDKGSKSGTPFNKDELTAILKFGAEELFKEGDNEGEDNCDIDEILRRAETHEEAARPGDELLSAFKVVSFTVNEQEDVAEPGSSAPEGGDIKEWEQIIPEDIRKRIEHEEKEKEMADLYLPPRSSRNAAGTTDSRGQPLGNEALNRKARSKKRKRGEKESEESESDEDGKPRKRGRPKLHAKEKVKGFTDAQIRKFLKSLKKFPSPLTRIEKVADDCGLTDRTLADLKELGEQLIRGCKAAVAEQKANPQPIIKEEPGLPPVAAEGGADGVKKRTNKPREKGPIFKVCGVGINARTMSIAIEELEPLGEIIPVDEASRKTWKLDFKVKVAPFDVDWTLEDDTKLLLGIWEHGMGSWEKIRESDPVLKEKIFLEGDKKPLLKHVHTRADYLLGVIKKHQTLQKLKQPKPKKKREPKIKKEKDTGASITIKTEDGVAAEGSSATAGKGANDAKPKGKRGPKKKDAGPMHFAAQTEPTPISVLGDLDPVIFNECKEKMRPVKKALKALDNPDSSLSEKEQILQTRNCLLQIGNQIDKGLEPYAGDKAQVKQWKSFLWYFVSKFTEYNAKDLHKLYRKAVRKGKSSKEKKSKDKSKEKPDKKDKSDKKDKDKAKSKEKSEKKDKPDKKIKDKSKDNPEKKEKDKEKRKEKREKDKKSSRRERELQNTSEPVFHKNLSPTQGDFYRERDVGRPYYNSSNNHRDNSHTRVPNINNQHHFHENSNSSQGDFYRERERERERDTGRPYYNNSHNRDVNDRKDHRMNYSNSSSIKATNYTTKWNKD